MPDRECPGYFKILSSVHISRFLLISLDFARALKIDVSGSLDDLAMFMSREKNLTSEEIISSILTEPAGIKVLQELVDIDPFSLNTPGRIDYLAALERQAGWLQALMQSAIVAVAGTEPTQGTELFSSVDDAEREDIALALRLSGTLAQQRIDVARVITQHLPATATALATGEISLGHANAIAKESAEIIRSGATPDQIAEVERVALTHAEFHTPTQVVSKMKAAIAKLAPVEFEEAVAVAHERRSVDCYPQANGMAQIVALLPAADAQIVMLAIDKLARLNKEHAIEEENLRQRQKARFTSGAKTLNKSELIDREAIAIAARIDAFRADALTQLANNYLNSTMNEGLAHGRPVTLNLTMDLPTLLGLAENPANLKGYGPIPASVARELAADAKWRKFVTDPVTGELLDVGRRSYEPPQALKDFLTSRDQICRFPHCRQPARVSDIDHAQPWEDGGETSRVNMGMLCRRHHRMKTHGGWKLESFPDGSCEWESPSGKRYFVPSRKMDEAM